MLTPPPASPDPDPDPDPDTNDGSGPIFTRVAAVAPEQWHDRGMEEVGNLRDCSRRCVDLAAFCPDRDVAGILLDVAEEAERDARYIESMVGNGPAKGQPQRRAGDMPILATEPGPASLTD